MRIIRCWSAARGSEQDRAVPGVCGFFSAAVPGWTRARFQLTMAKIR